MELMTAQMLWANRDHRRLPLGETVLNTQVEERYTIKEFYFKADQLFKKVDRLL